MKSKIFVDRARTKCDVFMEWFAFALIGVLTGLTAAIMSDMEERITTFKRN